MFHLNLSQLSHRYITHKGKALRFLCLNNYFYNGQTDALAPEDGVLEGA